MKNGSAVIIDCGPFDFLNHHEAKNHMSPIVEIFTQCRPTDNPNEGMVLLRSGVYDPRRSTIYDTINGYSQILTEVYFEFGDQLGLASELLAYPPVINTTVDQWDSRYRKKRTQRSFAFRGPEHNLCHIDIEFVGKYDTSYEAQIIEWVTNLPTRLRKHMSYTPYAFPAICRAMPHEITKEEITTILRNNPMIDPDDIPEEVLKLMEPEELFEMRLRR